MERTKVVVDDADCGELVFDVRTAGPTDGVPVVLLHGFPQTSASLEAIGAQLGDAGYRVFAPDQRGYSPGARPAAVDAYRTDRLVADVLAIAEASGHERFHLVGHDWGGMVAWKLAAEHPDRLASLTALSVPHPRALARVLDGDLAEQSDQAERSWYVEVFRSDGAEDTMLVDDAAGLQMIYGGSGLSDEEAAPHLAALRAPGALAAALAWYRANDLGVPDLAAVSVPTLFIWSDGDVAVAPEGAEATGECVTGPYRFVVLEGVDHWIPDHAADQVVSEATAWFSTHE